MNEINRGGRLLGLGTVVVGLFVVGHVYLGKQPIPFVPAAVTPEPVTEPLTPVVVTPPPPPTPAPVVTTLIPTPKPVPKPVVAPTPAPTPAPAPTPTPAPTPAPPPPVVEAPKSPYRDGSYSATGSYSSPGGGESVTVSLTLKDGVVVSSSVQGNAQNPTSVQFQSMFISGYAQFVTGKSIDAVSLSRVSGSSLTPTGFNDAVAKIKAQAKA